MANKGARYLEVSLYTYNIISLSPTTTAPSPSIDYVGKKSRKKKKNRYYYRDGNRRTYTFYSYVNYYYPPPVPGPSVNHPLPSSFQRAAMPNDF